MSPPLILIAGIGNIFLGDDAFGVEVVRRLGRETTFPPSVRVVDFGIRGFDLACALVDGYDAVLLIDATVQGGAPGTLYVIESLPSNPASPGLVSGHDLHPAAVLQLAGNLGVVCRWVRVVGCEPLTFGSEEEPAEALSPPVALAVEEAVQVIERLVREILDGRVTI